MENLLKAIKFAAEKHAAQRRKDAAKTPYINHPIEVAELLSTVGKISDEDTLTAAILHDTIEDTDTTAEELCAHFGENVLNIVLELTDDKTLPKAERKQLQIDNAEHKSDAAKVCKLADKICNLKSIIDTPPADWDAERKRLYFAWAEEVAEGLLEVNQALDDAYYEVTERFENREMLDAGELLITCKPKFRKQCSLDWHELEDIKNPYGMNPLPRNKWCKTCEKTVHYVSTPEELTKHSQEGNCVAVYLEQELLMGDIEFDPKLDEQIEEVKMDQDL